MYDSDEENIPLCDGFDLCHNTISSRCWNQEQMNSPNVIGMFQQQQGLLQQLLDSQKKEKKHEEFEEKLQQISTTSNSSPDTDRANRKVRIRCDLTLSG